MFTQFYCNLPQTEINFTNNENKRVTIKFHAHYFETDDAETIKFLSDYQRQGVLVSVAGGEVDAPMQPEVDYTPVFKDDEPEFVTMKKSAKGKK